ncbi:hypothetical protein PCC8801_2113 [Rippkaea orientalis PCC 8801]|uniref:Uncharacterized protein n=1 Tax=Rippkaea orientalis (strain PCC 8801 / RF-1) TaxID=41431 RepID=B7JZZ8_RIPO1|nr:hypothetical protein [Rippkaea orientalis]ACK66145.1 hypothetical protein PCC8801_2113 [Rippkaea orientalis PCC 8801]
MKPIKHKLALGIAIALLTLFGVETLAMASPQTLPGTTVSQRDPKCGGDPDDKC